MPRSQLSPIHIFRAGRHTAMSGATVDFSDAQLAAAAAAYDPAVHEAPIVVGHPAHDAPAYGWVSGLSYSDAGLSAQPAQVDADFAEMVRAGRFKKVSASFYTPDSAANPKPGAYYLRHVGFLGAQPPAVKGLKQAEFADGAEGVVEIEFAESADDALWNRFTSWLATRMRGEPATVAATTFSEPHREDHAVTEKTAEQQAAEAAAAKRDAEFAEREASLKAREDALAANEQKARDQGCADFVEKLVDSGQVLPRDKAGLTALLASFATDAQVEFAEDGAQVKKPSADFLRGFLEHLPQAVDYSETATAASDVNSAAVINFAAPHGTAVDAAGAKLHAKALAYQANHKDVGYIDAVRAVGG